MCKQSACAPQQHQKTQPTAAATVTLLLRACTAGCCMLLFHGCYCKLSAGQVNTPIKPPSHAGEQHLMSYTFATLLCSLDVYLSAGCQGGQACTPSTAGCIPNAAELMVELTLCSTPPQSHTEAEHHCGKAACVHFSLQTQSHSLCARHCLPGRGCSICWRRPQAVCCRTGLWPCRPAAAGR